MNVSAPFIIRPIATTLLMTGVTLIGLVAYFVLPIAGVPQVDVPTIRVSARLPGANAETMATSVATPLEGQLSSIAVTSPDLPISKVDEYVENFLAPQISRIIGVGVVDFHGQQKPAIRIQINPAAAAAIGISLEDVRAALATATVNSPKGTLDGPKQSLTLDTTDQVFDAATFNDAIIAYRNGAPVRVRDLGRAVSGVESTREAAWLGGRRAVIIDVHKQPGYNINQTVQRVKD